MIEWSRDVASVIQLLLMYFLIILLIANKKKLGNGIVYFIIAIAVTAGIDTFVFLKRMSNATFNSTLIYNIGVNLTVFSLFFIYFYHVLEQKRTKILSLFLFAVLLLVYGVFSIFSKNFYSHFPFIFYFVELILLIGNIYLVLLETFNSDKVLTIHNYFPVWVCIGLMALYLGVAPLLIISNTASKIMNIKIFFIILFIVNMLGYSILLIGVFFARNPRKSEPYRN